MNQEPGPWWLRWLPADSRAGVRRRALIVWGVAAVIGVLQSLFNPVDHPLVLSLVYSYAISTAIWFLSDPMRIVLRRWLRLESPYYWTMSVRTMAYQFAAILVGYGIGSAIGDLWGHRSTWQQLLLSPQRFWSFLLWSAAISAGFLFYFYQREKAHALERLATETRLKLLESQLEPHMLFNTLANLRALIATDPTRAIGMLDRLNDFLRATLAASRSDSQTHTLQAEFDRLRDYLELMAVRMGPRLRYTLDLPDELAAHPVPPLLLQPLVENAIRHGLEPHVNGGQVSVRAGTRDDILELEVADNGTGFDSAAASADQPAGSGFGLDQVRERVAASFTGRGTVDLQTAPGQGTRVLLQLPLQHPAEYPPSRVQPT